MRLLPNCITFRLLELIPRNHLMGSFIDPSRPLEVKWDWEMQRAHPSRPWNTQWQRDGIFVMEE